MNRNEVYLPSHYAAPSQRFSERNRSVLHRPVRVERELQIPDLAYEVGRINAQGEEEKRLYDLNKTGFHVKDQIRLLMENMDNGIPLADSIQQIKQDVNGFNFEYLQEAPVFGIPLGFKDIDGQKRVVARLYGEKLWVDSTSEIEREGVVRESVGAAEKILATGKPGTLVVIHSGEGWSNYQVKGKDLGALSDLDVKRGIAQEIKFPDAQTYVAVINPDGSITAVTLKAHMNLSQSEAFVAKLQGKEPEETPLLSEKDRIKKVVGNVLKFSSEDGINTDSIIKTMKHIMGGNTAYRDTLGRERTFDEMRFMVQNPRALEELSEATERLTGKFSEYAAWRMGMKDENVTSDLQIALGYTILNLMHEVRGSKKKSVMKKDTPYRLSADDKPEFNAREMLEDLQEIPGCAGGGIGVDSAGGKREGVIGESDDLGALDIDCPTCNAKNKRPRGGWVYACQSCGSDKISCGRKPPGQETKQDTEPIKMETKRQNPPGGEAGKKERQEQKAA